MNEIVQIGRMGLRHITLVSQLLSSFVLRLLATFSCFLYIIDQLPYIFFSKKGNAERGGGKTKVTKAYPRALMKSKI